MSEEYVLELLECYEHPEEPSRNRDEWISMLVHGDQSDSDIMELVAERDALRNQLKEEQTARQRGREAAQVLCMQLAIAMEALEGGKGWLYYAENGAGYKEALKAWIKVCDEALAKINALSANAETEQTSEKEVRDAG